MCFLSPKIIILNIVVVIGLFGCFPANKKVALPDDDHLPKIDKMTHGTPTDSSQEVMKQVPAVLEKEFTLESEKKYQKHGLEKNESETFDEETLPGVSTVPLHSNRESEHTTQFLDPEYVKFRLDIYGKKLMAWNDLAGSTISLDAGDRWPDGWHKCLQGLEYMVFGYRRLLSSGYPDKGSYVLPVSSVDIVQKDVHYLESGCDKLFEASNLGLDKLLDTFSAKNRDQLRTLINGYMVEGNYQKVIFAYNNFNNVSAGVAADSDLGYQYVKALTYSGRYEDAADFINANIPKECFSAPSTKIIGSESCQSFMHYADLMLVLGRERQAKEAYLLLDNYFASVEKESDWVAGQLHFLEDYSDKPQKYSLYLELLREFLKADGRGIPEKMRHTYELILKEPDDQGLIGAARRIMRKIEEQARLWADQQFLEIEGLLAEKKFHEAKILLENLRGLPDGMEAELAILLEQVEAEEQKELAALKQLEKQQLTVKWEEAVRYFEMEQYDKAISAFTALLQSDYKAKAKIKIDKAIMEFAALMRRQAAAVFIEAQKSQDPEEKRRLFLESRSILVQLLEKYPTLDIAEKIVRNLEALEKQISVFAPNELIQ